MKKKIINIVILLFMLIMFTGTIYASETDTTDDNNSNYITANIEDNEMSTENLVKDNHMTTKGQNHIVYNQRDVVPAVTSEKHYYKNSTLDEKTDNITVEDYPSNPNISMPFYMDDGSIAICIEPDAHLPQSDATYSIGSNHTILNPNGENVTEYIKIYIYNHIQDPEAIIYRNDTDSTIESSLRWGVWSFILYDYKTENYPDVFKGFMKSVKDETLEFYDSHGPVADEGILADNITHYKINFLDNTNGEIHYQNLISIKTWLEDNANMAWAWKLVNTSTIEDKNETYYVNVTEDVPYNTTEEYTENITETVPVVVTQEYPVEITVKVPYNTTEEYTENITETIPVVVTQEYPVEITVEVPYNTTEEYTENITESIPVVVTEEYPVEVTVEVPYNTTEEYTENITYHVPLNKTETYYVNVTKEVPYNISEEYTENISGEIPKTEAKNINQFSKQSSSGNILNVRTDDVKSVGNGYLRESNQDNNPYYAYDYVVKPLKNDNLLPKEGKNNIKIRNKTLYKNVTVPEKRERTVTYYENRTDSVTKNRTVTKYKNVTTTETRKQNTTTYETVTRQVTKNRTVTKYKNITTTEIRQQNTTTYETITRQVTKNRTVTKYKPVTYEEQRIRPVRVVNHNYMLYIYLLYLEGNISYSDLVAIIGEENLQFNEDGTIELSFSNLEEIPDIITVESDSADVDVPVTCDEVDTLNPDNLDEPVIDAGIVNAEL